MRNQRHAKDLPGHSLGFRGIGRKLDAAAFPSSAGMDLSLDDDLASELPGRLYRLLDGFGHLAAWHRYAVFGQQGFGLILVDFHRIS